MGTRGQVRVTSREFDTPLYLYAHYDADDLFDIVKRAISRGIRWEDPEYFIRIIFSEMVGDSVISGGFGIGTRQHGDIEYLVDVDVNNQLFYEYVRKGDDMIYTRGMEFSAARDGEEPFIMGDV